MSKLDTQTPVGPAPDQSPITLSWILAVGVIIVAILAAVIAIVVVRRADAPTVAQPPAASAPPASAPAGTPGSGTSQAGPCAPVAQAAGGPVLAAPETTWNFVDTLAVPTTNAGPATVNGPLATCYSPDTLGALTAAAQIYLRANANPGGDIVREKQTTPDSGFQSEDAKKDWQENPRVKPWLQLHAFRAASAIENNRVDLALQLKTADNLLTPVFNFTMVWTGSDWTLGPLTSQGPVTDDPTMITWEGV